LNTTKPAGCISVYDAANWFSSIQVVENVGDEKEDDGMPCLPLVEKHILSSDSSSDDSVSKWKKNNISRNNDNSSSDDDVSFSLPTFAAT